MANKHKSITKEMREKARELASKGLNKSQVAQMLGMGKSTLYDKIKEDLELSEHIRQGELEAIEEVTNALFETALKGNVSAQIFFLKNRGDWKDKTETELSGHLKHHEIEVTFR